MGEPPQSSVRIELKPSRLLASVLVLAHCTAVALVGIAPLPMVVMVAMAAGLTLSGVTSVRRAARLSARSSVTALESTNAGRLNVRTRDGRWRECEVLDSTFVAPFLTVINLRDCVTRHVLHSVIMFDSVLPDDFRRLRVWLRWKEDDPETT